LQLFACHGIAVVVDGGWGVDALLNTIWYHSSSLHSNKKKFSGRAYLIF
jgi:hypothetical protein